MKNFKEKILKIADKVVESKIIDDYHYSFGKGLSDFELTDLEKNFNIKIDNKIKELYSQVNGVKIDWVVKGNSLNGINSSPKEDITGSINVLDLENLLSGYNKSHPWKNILWFDFTDDKLRKDLIDIRPFDFYNRDNNECIVFKIEDNILSSKMKYYSLNHGFMNFNFTLEKYVDYLQLACGFLFWQRALIFKGKYLKELKHYLPQIFPSIDLSNFR